MPTLRTYQKPEEAFIVAGYLCSMGVEAVVSQDPACSGVLPGVIDSPHKLEVPEAQVEEATALLAQRPVEALPPAQIQDAHVDSTRLHRFLRFILIYDTGCYIFFAFFGHISAPETPQPVVDFLASLAVSDSLWQLSYASYWPVIVLGILSNILCYFYISVGRTLFALTTVWCIVMLLGPPPMIFGPYYGFFGGIQSTLTSIALALMFWSPLRDRFNSSPHA
jgi:hypothetical protein